MQKEKNDLQKLNEQLDDLYKRKIILEKIIEDEKAKLNLYLKTLNDIEYDIDLKDQYIEIIKKHEGTWFE